MILSRSRPVSLCSRISRIACDCLSESMKVSMRPCLASFGSLADLISSMTASRLSRAIVKPSRMWAFFGLAQLEHGSAANDLAAVIDVMFHHLLEIENERAVVDENQIDYAETALHLSMLVQLVENDIVLTPLRSSIQTRIPSRLDSSRRSVMPSIFFSLIRSAIDLTRRALLT